MIKGAVLLIYKPFPNCIEGLMYNCKGKKVNGRHGNCKGNPRHSLLKQMKQFYNRVTVMLDLEEKGRSALDLERAFLKSLSLLVYFFYARLPLRLQR